MSKAKGLIVGIDPGTTTGIAILDINGNIIETKSVRNCSISNVIDHLLGKGNVLVVATDVEKIPKYVEKIANQLGAEIFVPEESIKIKEKREITKSYGVRDSHQRDALASAIAAYKKYSSKFRKIDSMDLTQEEKERVKEMLIRGVKIADALQKIAKKEETKKKEVMKPEIQERPGKIKKEQSKRKISEKALIDEIDILKEKLYEKELEIKELKDKLLKLRRKYILEFDPDLELRKKDKIIQDLESKIFELKKELHEMEKLERCWNLLIEGKIIPIAIFPKVLNGTSYLNRKAGKNEKKLIKKMVERNELRSLFYDNANDLKDIQGLSILKSQFIKRVSNCYYIEKEDWEKLRQTLGKISRERIETQKSLEDIIEEYRKSRMRELGLGNT